jgi:hypothetical protein
MANGESWIGGGCSNCCGNYFFWGEDGLAMVLYIRGYPCWMI